MKNLFLLAVLTLGMLSCSKESQSVTTTEEPITQTVTFTASDRDAGSYQFGLTNCTLTSYVFEISVSEVGGGSKVYHAGGWYTGNFFDTVVLTPGHTYVADLTLSPPNPGQTGTIHWHLKNYLGYVMCAQGDRAIPSQPTTSLNWPACQ